MDISKKIASRRSFVAGVAALGVVAASATEARASEPEHWDEECDVLIIGSGYAGLSAAYEAIDAGASVKIIEKLDIPGGNSMISGGDIAVCGSKPQADAGIEDSVENYIQDMLTAGDSLNDVEKCRIIAEKSNETWEWTCNVLGAGWVCDEEGNPTLVPCGGHYTLRSFRPTDGRGSNVVLPLLDILAEKGVEVECGRMLASLIQDESGRVVGAEIRDGAKGQVGAGEPCFIRANRAVVLATGGFGRDVTWRMAHDPRLDASVDCTNAPGATAEALCAALECGALPVHLDWIQCGPWCSPDEEGYGVGPDFIDRVAAYSLDLNPQTGRRVCSELTDRKRYCDAILAVGEPLIQVVNESNLPSYVQDPLAIALDRGVTLRFDSIDEVCEHFDLPADAVAEQLTEYNGYVTAKKDDQFGKAIPDDAVPIDEGPFYITRRWPKVHHCMGGIKTDIDCHVLDIHLNPIPGFYAAGEVTGGIHGACRLGNCAVADCLVNGRIAGKNAAANDPIA